MDEVYLYGAGGHAKVIIDILKSNQIRIRGIFDDNPKIHTLIGIPVSHSEICSPLIISIGNNQIRKLVADKLSGIIFHPAVSAKSTEISKNVVVGDGTVVMQNVVIQSSVRIGKHCIINTKASIDHDCVIHNYVHIAPGVILCGNVEIGEGSFIGAGATIIPGIKIGKWSVIGAGSVVTKDIPDNVVAYGSPCKIIKQNDV